MYAALVGPEKKSIAKRAYIKEAVEGNM